MRDTNFLWSTIATFVAAASLRRSSLFVRAGAQSRGRAIRVGCLAATERGGIYQRNLSARSRPRVRGHRRAMRENWRPHRLRFGEALVAGVQTFLPSQRPSAVERRRRGEATKRYHSFAGI